MTTTGGAFVVRGAVCRIVIDDFSDFAKDYPHANIARDQLNFNAASYYPDNGRGQGIGGTDGGAWYEADATGQDGTNPLGLWWCSDETHGCG